VAIDSGLVPGVHTTSPALDAPTRPLALAAAVTAAFAAYGIATQSPNTILYIATVVALTAVVHHHRDRLSPALALSLVAVAALHLAGGLVRVGDDVLYNASAGGQLLRYDHLVHSLASVVGTLVCCRVLGLRREAALLAGMGLGAVNETVEFLSTTMNASSHVGGYTNTGWDLVSNLAGCLVACVIISRRASR